MATKSYKGSYTLVPAFSGHFWAGATLLAYPWGSEKRVEHPLCARLLPSFQRE